MSGARTLAARFLSVVLPAAIAVVASMSCYAIDMLPTGTACCEQTHDCGRMGDAHECCTTEAPRADQATTVARVTVSSPPHVLAAILPVFAVDATLIPSNSAPLLTSVKPPGIPRYLAVSALRI